MIFVTVGSQMPFDRLIHTVDRWVQKSGRTDVFAQIGPSISPPLNLRWSNELSPAKFRKYIQDADFIVSHAGMGTILTALELSKPILVMPRRGDLMETRNDHQIATAKRFEEQGRLVAAYDEDSLLMKLNDLQQIRPGQKIDPYASPQLIKRLQSFVDSF